MGRRVMPESLIQFSSPEGRKIFKESLAHGSSEAFFPLSEQFLSQSEPAYCGVTSLVMILNAMGIDPKVRWKSGWRWYSDEMILDTCCIDAERVKRAGILMEEFQSLARCQGLGIDMKRPLINGYGDEQEEEEKETDDAHGLDEFRKNIIQMVRNPPMHDAKEISSDKDRGGFLVVSYSRPSLGQTGSGHFSPVAAYHEASDRCLIMDVARYKYAPYWVRVKDLYESLRPIDKMTGKSRGWFMMYPPQDTERFKGAKVHDEGKRFASEDKETVCCIGRSQTEEPEPTTSAGCILN